MKKLTIRIAGMFTVAILVLSLLLFALPVSATTVGECKADISTLMADTVNATYKNAKDQATLLSKLDGAVVKLDQLKFTDAILKLTEYRDKVLTLILQNKIAPSADGTVTPRSLEDGANTTIVCVQSLING